MASSTAPTVSAYLASVPPERRKIAATLRKLIRISLPKGNREAMNFGMIGYDIPLTRYPKTYNGPPLVYAAIAAEIASTTPALFLERHEASRAKH